MPEKLKVAILGSGNIGTDLVVKVQRSRYLECAVMLGRNLASPGMAKAQSLGIQVSADSIRYLEEHPACCDLVFDATSAQGHQRHAPILAALGKIAIDLTPAKVGTMCIPAVNLDECLRAQNVNMVTCGGQASIPVAHVLARTHEEIEYIEVISSIASRSAGPATRTNLDEYIHTTELGIKTFTNARHTKAILNLNPAQPCIDMQTTVLAKVGNPDIDRLTAELQPMVRAIQKYVPGYELLVGPLLEGNRLVIMVRVKGLGDYLPAYAGNLDIINCAAIAMAEQYAINRVAGAAEWRTRCELS